MARLGLGDSWNCAFANDICEKKATAYRGFFGHSPELLVRDVGLITSNDLPGVPALVWASFPCQDLSLAGSGAGLAGKRSGTFMPFWKLVQDLLAEGRGPKMIVLENVTGALTSHGGRDFETLVQSLAGAGYNVGALVLDAAWFLPQSRPRLFIVGVQSAVSIPSHLRQSEPSEPWHTRSLRNAYTRLSQPLQNQWVWWCLPMRRSKGPALSSLMEDEPTGTKWHTTEQTQRIVDLMSPLHRRKLERAMKLGKRVIGTVYKRTRPDENGVKAQRAEIRFDEVSGCLRTPGGGSSRQIIMVVEGKRVRSRLLSPREAARLMGVPDEYPLPHKYNDAYHVFGDGLAVPVVAWLNENLLLPLARAEQAKIAA